MGLTGGVATGKTLAAQYFQQLGALVFDADHNVHDLLSNDQPCIQRVKQAFGESVVDKEKVKRGLLADIVFSNKKRLKQLEDIVHPFVRKRAERFLISNKKAPWVVLDIPLLFETNYWKSTNINIVVKANQQLQIERIIARSAVSRTQALQRIHAQMPMAKKIKLADEVLDNRGTKRQLKKQIRNIYIKYILKNEKRGK